MSLSLFINESAFKDCKYLMFKLSNLFFYEIYLIKIKSNKLVINT